MELSFLDGELERTLPDNAMLKVYTYQTQIKRIQALFFSECSPKINSKLSTIVAKVTRDFTTAFGWITEREQAKALLANDTSDFEEN